MDIAVAEGIVCLRVNDPEMEPAKSALPRAKESLGRVAAGGGVECHDPGDIIIESPAPDWKHDCHSIARISGGAYEGMRAVGIAAR